MRNLVLFGHRSEFSVSQVTFFSVVIPTYNRADLLRETLDSVLRQRLLRFRSHRRR